MRAWENALYIALGMLGNKWSPLGGIYTCPPPQRTLEIYSYGYYCSSRILFTNIQDIYKSTQVWNCVEDCRTLWNPLEHDLEKSQEIQCVLKRPVTHGATPPFVVFFFPFLFSFLQGCPSDVSDASNLVLKKLSASQFRKFSHTWMVCLYVTIENHHQQFSTSGCIARKGPPEVTSA